MADNADRTPLWALIEERREGRSWNWIGAQMEEPVTGSAIRSWASGRTRIKPFQADQLARVLGVHPDEVRAAAGLEAAKEPRHGAPITERDELKRRLLSSALADLDSLSDDEMRQLLSALAEVERRRDDFTNDVKGPIVGGRA